MDSRLRRLSTCSRCGLWIGPVVALIVWLLPLHLPVTQHRLLGLIALAFIWWIAETVPLAYTALLVPTLATLLGITSTKAAFAPFAQPAIFLFLGGFFIAKAMEVNGLDQRVALFVLSRRQVGGHAWRSIVALTFTAALISMWVSNTATMAMFLPVTMGLAATLYPGNRDAQGTILIAVAYAVSLGGLATPVGTPPNIVAIGFIEGILNHDISFLAWCKVGFPLFLLLMLALLAITRRELPKTQTLTDASQFIRSFLSLGRIKRGEVNIIICFFVAVGLWLSPSVFQMVLGLEHPATLWITERLPEAVVSILAASILFILPSEKGTPTLEWKDAVKVDWGTLLLFGGGLSLGAMIFDSGLAKTFGDLFAQYLDSNIEFGVFIFVIVFFTIFFGEVTSNTACATMMIPIAIGLAQATGFNPVPTAVAIGMASSIGFMTPISTPPNAIAFSSGIVPLKKMMKMGLMLNVIGGLILIAFFWALRTFGVEI